MSSLFPAKGFLGTGATFEADLTLIVQLMMGITLILGAVLAKHKRYAAHGICQTTVLFLNLIMIALLMLPSFHVQVVPALPHVFRKRYYAVATVHGLLGMAAELLGLYIVAAAGTKLVPQSLRFSRWRPWMRAELMLWWVVLLGGVATYYVWYVAPVP